MARARLLKFQGHPRKLVSRSTATMARSRALAARQNRGPSAQSTEFELHARRLASGPSRISIRAIDGDPRLSRAWVTSRPTSTRWALAEREVHQELEPRDLRLHGSGSRSARSSSTAYLGLEYGDRSAQVVEILRRTYCRQDRRTSSCTSLGPAQKSWIQRAHRGRGQGHSLHPARASAPSSTSLIEAETVRDASPT